jgi:uncharacterized membrane protein
MYQAILLFHILCGTAALISGFFAILFKKGKGKHSTAGKVYYISMYGVGLTSLTMCLLKFNLFLLCIGIFSTYLTYSGRQAILYWQLKQQHRPLLKEKLPFYTGLATAVVMAGYALFALAINGDTMGIPLLVFGLVLLSNVVIDIRMFRKPENFGPRNSRWLIKHIGMMGGAYIATVTAFVVVNVQFSPGWVPWLAPSVIGGLLIRRTMKQWSRKLKIGKASRAKPSA